MSRVKIGRYVAVAMALALSACAGQSTAADHTNQTLIVEQGFRVDDLDPAHGGAVTDALVDKSVYDTLLAANPRDLTKPYPQLATSYTESSDAKTFTFKLRHGVKFASGNPMTSADVVYSINRVNGI